MTPSARNWRRGGVRIGLHLQPKLLRTGASAPILRERQKEMLHGRLPILLCVEVDILAFRIFHESNVGQAQASIVVGWFSP